MRACKKGNVFIVSLLVNMKNISNEQIGECLAVSRSHKNIALLIEKVIRFSVVFYQRSEKNF